ncbi:von Willebrand factor type A domain-containing protein [Mycena floridula]|nr:von Willebrand factor type A domain-containing protein [Mycena floridula]
MYFWGLCYYSNHQVVSLPLLHVNAGVTIKDLAAQVKLTQGFTNDAPVSVDAVYTFPVPARAAVSGFALVKEDGTRVVGVVQEKAEAQKTYDTAVSEGKLASLMVQQTPDVFQVSVGNILSQEKVTIELLYSTELTEDEENDSIRFLLPFHIGARYGQAPSSYVQSQALDVHVAISVESLSLIRKISCPSHSVSVQLGPDSAVAQDLPFSNYARVSLASDSALNQDFVLAIEATGLDSPRCLAEVHPTNDTVSLALTLVPKFSLPDPSSQEFIFLVDRSGSMDGSRIAAARKALVIMLRSLPRKNTFFQIVSFGTNASSLWHEGSRLYDQESLDEATRHVDSMQANFGGTEIRRALDSCFEKRLSDRPTSVFLLTDGDAWGLDGVLAVVKEKVTAVQSKSSYLRVFTLGIGDSASTAMCEGIARMGNGACMVVGEKEATMTGKIARLLKAARTPPISDLSIDWGRDDDTQTLDEDDFEMVAEEKVEKPAAKFNIFNQSVDPLKSDIVPVPPVAPVVLGPPARVQESPNKLENLFPGVRVYLYAILQDKTILPQTAIIRGKTPDGSEIALPVPVTLSRLPGTTAVHSLAARKIIQDLEDGRYDESLKSNVTADLGRVVKAHIVRLGKTYSISSKHTSFVAVDESSTDEGRSNLYSPVGLFDNSRQVQMARQVVQLESPRYSDSSSAAPIIIVNSRSRSKSRSPRHSAAPLIIAARSRSRSRSRSPQRHSVAAGAAAPIFIARSRPRSRSDPLEALARWSRSRSMSPYRRSVSPNPFETPTVTDPLEALARWSRHSAAPLIIAARSRSRSRSRSPQRHSVAAGAAAPIFIARSRSRSRSMSRARSMSRSISPYRRSVSPNPFETPTVTDPLEALARLQSFDGGFTMQILNLVSLEEETARAAFPGLEDVVIATILALGFIATKLKDRQMLDVEAWEGIYEKAKEYLEDQASLDIEDLMKKAAGLGL